MSKMKCVECGSDTYERADFSLSPVCGEQCEIRNEIEVKSNPDRYRMDPTRSSLIERKWEAAQ